MSLLTIKDLVYETDGRRILDDLNMSLGTREVHALLGTNGTGKTTLAYLIMGCEGYHPTAGEIVFEGRNLTDLKIHERARLGIALGWQEPVRFEGLSVMDYLLIGRKPADPSRCLEMVGLHPELYLHRMVDKSLSGGERKRIELASILALHPRLAVLDEPDSGIDLLSTQDIIGVIQSFKNRDASVLLITHREEIAMIADTASQICNGRIVCSGNPQRVAAYYKSRACLTCDGRECHYV